MYRWSSQHKRTWDKWIFTRVNGIDLFHQFIQPDTAGLHGFLVVGIDGTVQVFSVVTGSSTFYKRQVRLHQAAVIPWPRGGGTHWYQRLLIHIYLWRRFAGAAMWPCAIQYHRGTVHPLDLKSALDTSSSMITLVEAVPEKLVGGFYKASAPLPVLPSISRWNDLVPNKPNYKFSFLAEKTTLVFPLPTIQLVIGNLFLRYDSCKAQLTFLLWFYITDKNGGI